ncbi:MAG TPA: hypothetical protein PLL06_01900, partial [Acidobacteriota bacterium]|nr:hypothetical protein [Acidobacteriota bacterium]
GINTTNSTEFVIATFFISYFMGWYHGPVAAIVGEIVPASLRGTAIALYMFGIHILGDTPAPAIIGYLSDRLSTTGGLRSALFLTIIANGLAGLLFILVTFVLRRRAGLTDSMPVTAVATAQE